ncbi:MAG: hypothetical protein U9N57_01085 [Pseudomonadota bacterium]|nr:hypothetical protein [Pseudomonadota bacterium]
MTTSITKQRLLKRTKNLAQIIKNEQWESRTKEEINLIQAYVADNADKIVNLMKLSAKTGRVNQEGFNARVEFMKVVNADYEIKGMIHSYKLIEVSGLSPRTIDDCFEMGDGRQVALHITGQAQPALI